MSEELNKAPADSREAFEAWAIAEGYILSDPELKLIRVGWQAAMASKPSDALQGKPTDISIRLREYANDPSYIHAGFAVYADTMRAAAGEIERYYGGMLAWKATAEAKDKQLAEKPSDAQIRDAALEEAAQVAGNKVNTMRLPDAQAVVDAIRAIKTAKGEQQ